MDVLGNLPSRVQSPEERELERKRNELAALEADLVEQELRLSTLQAELAAFKTEYLRVVGVRFAELDDLKARIAETLAAKAPTNDAAQAAATEARATAEFSAAEAQGQGAQEPAPPFDPPGEVKTLYRTIARRVHPDLAATDDERERRHDWMAKANDAYQQQDSEALAALLSDWETSPESVSGTGTASDLVRVIRQLDQVRRRLDSIAWTIRELQAGDLYALQQKRRIRAEAGGNLLEEMAVSVDDQIATARQELAALGAEAP
ncbi:MAG: molecular chaperone DnaJ [Acidobacteria bacterium]|nr:molecular chaperone DnaJ [Acidobacteriota bacterium]